MSWTLTVWMPALLLDVVFVPHNGIGWVVVLISIIGGFALLVYLPYLWPRKEKWLANIRDLGGEVPPAFRFIYAGRRDFRWGVVGLLVAQSALMGGMWLPPEIITVKGDGRVRVGYVLEERDSQMLIFWADGRGILRYESDRVIYRQICDIGQSRPVSLASKVKLEGVLPEIRHQPCPKWGSR